MSADSVTEGDVRMAFRVLLGRERPDPALLAQWAERVDNLIDLRNALVAMPEYSRPGAFERRRAVRVDDEMLSWSRKLAPSAWLDEAGRPETADQLVERLLGTGAAAENAADVKVLQSKSMPRSGHHFLVSMLDDYLGSEFAYCEFYKPVHCCKTIPCARPIAPAGRNRYFLQKSHDFFFEDPVDPSQNYLIEYRHVIPRSQSNFEYAVREGRREDSFDEFWDFVDTSVAYQIHFIGKWIESPPPRSILLAYETLNARPEDELGRVLEFITGSPADPSKIRRTVERVRPTNAHTNQPFSVRKVEQHRYFDLERARRAEARIAEAFPSLELPGMPAFPEPAQAR